MEKPVISLIIATHNNGEDLRRAIVSTCEQDFTLPYEVIIVIDACTDGTLALVTELEKKYPHLRHYEVANRSLPKNRIFGVKNALGDYIMFLDGDDYIASNMMSKMYEAMIKYDVDMVNCSLTYVKKNGLQKAIIRSNALLDHYQALQAFFNDITIRGFMHLKMFKRELFLKIDFIDKLDLKNIMYEDTLFTFFYLLQCRKVKNIKDRLHFYNKTNEASMTRTGYNRCTDSMAVRNLFRVKIEELDDPKIRKMFRRTKFRIWTLMLADIVMSKFPDKATKKQVKKNIYSDFHNMFAKDFKLEKAIYKELIYLDK